LDILINFALPNMCDKGADDHNSRFCPNSEEGKLRSVNCLSEHTTSYRGFFGITLKMHDLEETIILITLWLQLERTRYFRGKATFKH
jgi:hypothetical protein